MSACAANGQSLGDLGSIAGQVLKQPAAQGALSNADITAGLKEALAKGTRSAVNQLGHSDGYWKDARFRIPLPKTVVKTEAVLRNIGMGSQLDELHLSMNRAAEQAVPIAADVFAGAVQKLTLQDVQGILNGPQDSATQYFKGATRDTLTTQFKPIVARVTAQSGLAQQYKSLITAAGPMASLLGPSTDLDSYVTQKALDGLFLRVADEEKAIRTNPAARTTDILKRVFGS